MLTNLVASLLITLSTNVVTTDNAQRETYYNGTIPTSNPPLAGMGERIVTPATEKYETSTITETRTLEFEVEGKKFSEVLGTRTVSSTVTTYHLKQEWTKGETRENAQAVTAFGDTYVVTDASSATNITWNTSSGSGSLELNVEENKEFVKWIAKAVRELDKDSTLELRPKDTQ